MGNNPAADKGGRNLGRGQFHKLQGAGRAGRYAARLFSLLHAVNAQVTFRGNMPREFISDYAKRTGQGAGLASDAEHV